MPLSQKSTSAVQLILGSLGQVFLYHIGIFAYFYFILLVRNSFVQVPLYFAFWLIPLQATYLRRGKRAFLYSAGLSFVLLVLFRIVMVRALLSNAEGVLLEHLGSLAYPFITLETVTLACLIGGLALVNFYTERRALYRLLAAAAGSGIVGIVTALVITRNTEVLTAFQDFLTEASRLFPESFGEDGAAVSAELSSRGALFKALWHYSLTGFLFGNFINLAAAWYVGIRVTERMTGGSRSSFLGRFTLPDFFVWPLIGSWALVLLTRLLQINYFDSLFLNIALIFLFLYGMQGLSVTRYLVGKYNLARYGRWLLLGSVVFALMFPIITLIVYVVVPGLGISEVWIKYRTRRKEQDER